MPVDPGAFQTIIEVGWATKPRLLILKLLIEAPFTWDDGIGGPIGNPTGFNFSARIISDLGGGEVRFGNWRAGTDPFGFPPEDGFPTYRNNNYLGDGEARRAVGQHSGKGSATPLVPQWGCAIAIDLELVRQAFIATSDEETSAASGDGVFPLDIRVEVNGAPYGGTNPFTDNVELTAELYRGGRGEYVEVERNTNVYDWSPLETRGTPVVRSISSSMPYGDPVANSSQFGPGSLMETLIVGLKEMTLAWEAALT